MRAVNLSPVERVGVVLLGLWVLWVSVSAFAHGSAFSDALLYFSAPTFAVLGMVATHLLHARGLMEGFAAFLLSLAVVVLFAVTLMGGAGGGPLGYSNANAALGIQLTAVAAITAMSVRGRARASAVWAAALFAFAVPWTLSWAGIALLVPFLAASLLAAVRPVRRRPWAIPVGAAMVVAAGVGIVTIARTSDWTPGYERAFSGARRELWSEALGLWGKHPVTGGGPGSFKSLGGLMVDTDTERVHMSVLQVGSELGAIGVFLFGTLVLVAFLALATAEPRARLIGSAAVASLFIHSFVDHLLEFPAIPLAMGMVVGLARHSRSGVNHT